MKKKALTFFSLVVLPMFVFNSNAYELRNRVFRGISRLPSPAATVKIDPPQFFPLPTRAIIRPIISPVKKLTGTLFLYAETYNCGRQVPFQGNFRICPGTVDRFSLNQSDSDNSNISNSPCLALRMNESGEGKIELPAGSYTIYPPNTCLKGEMCIMSGKITPLMVDPYEWKIDPQKFYLAKGEIVQVQAIGTNTLLMCPIVLE